MYEYEYMTYGDYGSSSANVDPAAAVVILIVMFLAFIIAYAVGAIFLGMIFKKAGVSAGKAWIPIYNQWVLNELGGQHGWWIFVPIANIIFGIIAIHNINLKLGYGAGMTVLALFLSLIWLIIVAVTKNPWNDSLGAPRLDQPSFAAPQPYAPQPQQNQPYATPPQPVAQQQYPGQPPVVQSPTTPTADQNTPPQPPYNQQ